MMIEKGSRGTTHAVEFILPSSCASVQAEMELLSLNILRDSAQICFIFDGGRLNFMLDELIVRPRNSV